MHLRLSLPTGKLMKWGDVPQQSWPRRRRWMLECRGGTGRGVEVRILHPACSLHLSVALSSPVSPGEPREGCWEDTRVRRLQKEDLII